jgi:hypothetical protein
MAVGVLILFLLLFREPRKLPTASSRQAGADYGPLDGQGDARE